MYKVVHISSVHPADDVRIFLKEARSLARAGYDVSLVARGEEDATRDGVRVSVLKSPKRGRLARFILTAWDTYRTARAMKADVYHFHDPELMPFGTLLQLTGARVIYDVHEDVPKQLLSKAWLPMWARWPVSKSIALVQFILTRISYSAIVAATPAISRLFPPGKTELVQNYPMLGELIAPGKSIPMRERPMEFLYVGGISQIRGILEDVTAIGRVKNEDARLVVAGRFEAQSLEDKARALSGWSRVDYLGQQSRKEVAERMARARAGIVLFLPEPNHVEAQPNKMFEYMSAGLPVIASDFPLWREIIGSANCGLLVDPTDPDAIAKAMDWIADNPDEAEEMGRRGQRAVFDIYNWQAEEKKLIALYDRLVGQRRESPEAGCAPVGQS